MRRVNDLRQLEEWLQPLLARLSAVERGRVARAIGTRLRRNQTARIKSQLNPDGTAFAPRKQQTRARKGSIKRAAMFSRIRQTKHLRITANADEVTVGFLGRVARIAQVHQDGGMDRVRPGGPRVRYEQRQLLGFTEQDINDVRETLIDHLSKL